MIMTYVVRAARRLGFLFGNNNGRAKAFWFFTLFLLILAIMSGFGEPILSSTVQNWWVEIPASRYHQDVYDAVISTAPLGETVDVARTWRLWRWFFSFFAFTFFYSLWAAREEMGEAIAEVERLIREREDVEARTQAPQQGGATIPSPVLGNSGRVHSFWRLLKIDVLGDLIFEVLRRVAVAIFTA